MQTQHEFTLNSALAWSASSRSAHGRLGLLSPEKTSNALSLFDLPAELRNKIYQLILEPVDMPIYHSDVTINGVFLGSTPSILRVCKQSREEAMKMFLANNNFVIEVAVGGVKGGNDLDTFPSQKDVFQYLEYLGPQNVGFVKNLIIAVFQYKARLWGQYNKTGMVKVWNEFIPALLARGLERPQIREITSYK